MRKILLITLIGISTLIGCRAPEKTLKVAATPVPHAEILEAIKTDLENEGIYLKIVEVDDYNLPNRLLYEKQVDANFFQHLPFLEEQNRRFGYHLQVLTPVHIEPLGIYSHKITELEQLKEGAKIAIPSDPSNETRALYLLSELGLLKLKTGTQHPTIYDIVENPKHLRVEEIDSAFLCRALDDVDAAIIPANFALQVGLNPSNDALALESTDSPYANVVAIREGEEGREELQKLKEALRSSKMREWIHEKYQNVLAPVN